MHMQWQRYVSLRVCVCMSVWTITWKLLQKSTFCLVVT